MTDGRESPAMAVVLLMSPFDDRARACRLEGRTISDRVRAGIVAEHVGAAAAFSFKTLPPKRGLCEVSAAAEARAWRGSASLMPVETVFPLQGKRVWVAATAAWSARHRPQAGRGRLQRADGRARRGRPVAQDDVDRWLTKARPDTIFLAAARVGGIIANSSRPADFLYENLIISANVARRRTGTGSAS